MTPEQLFAAARQRASAQPLVTFYDDATGERAELSPASLGNWIAKTHFLLQDELGLGVGDRALICLPPHWQSLVVYLGVWSAGLEVVTSGSAAVAFTTGSPIDTDADEVFALALAPWGRGFDGPAPAGATDYVAAVRPQADAWNTVHFPGAAADPALDGHSRAEVVAAASARATELGLAPGARVLLTAPAHQAQLDLMSALAPLAVAGTLVLVRNFAPGADPAAHSRRLAQENVTHDVTCT